MTDLDKLLRRMKACDDAREWAKSQLDLATAWDNCERADWMLWFAGKAGVDRKLLVLAACGCARTALRYVPKGEERPRIVIETAERWARDKATLHEVRSAAAAAAAATYAASSASSAAAAATYAAAYAAYAAAAATDAADHAATAANAAADAAAAATYAAYAASADAHTKAHQRMCKIVRKHFPEAPEVKP